jgi:hypothetical protein
MRKLLLLVAVLLAALPAHGAIAFVGASATCGTAVSGTSFNVTYTSAGSHQILVSVALKPTTTTVSSVSDSGGSTYNGSALAAGNNASSYRAEIWGTTNSVASTTFTVNTSGTITNAVACVSEYSGGGSFGASNSGSGASGTSWSQAVTTTGNNSWVIASIVVNAAEASFTGSSGTTVRANNTTTFTNAIADQSCGAAGSCTNSGTYPTSHTNEVAAVELQVASGAAPAGVNKRIKLEQFDNSTALLQ